MSKGKDSMIGATDVLMDASDKEKGRRQKMQLHLIVWEHATLCVPIRLWLIKDGIKRERGASKQNHVASRQHARTLVAWRLLNVDEVTSVHPDLQFRRRQPTPKANSRTFEGQDLIMFEIRRLL